MVPRPSSVELLAGQFVLDSATALHAEDACGSVARWLRATLGLALPPTGARVLSLAVDPALPAEGYHLVVREKQCTISGGSAAGVFYGAQTLLQLLPPAVYRYSADPSWAVPCVDISDAPRYAWRGLMLDVARHFLPKAGVLRMIDLIAAHKLNVLHLHLTDDQGWRLQIRRHPRLTEVGAWRRQSMVGSRQHEQFDGRPHGGYYTQDDIREIVAYAADRCVTVVPEIDLPGHAQAALAAYPELGNNRGEPVEVSTRWGVSTRVFSPSDETIAFLHGVFDEVMDLFPSVHIGIGGDECPKDEWRTFAATRRSELGLDSFEELQAWFLRQIAAQLSARGRIAYGWDEILEGGSAPGATVAAWRGSAVAVAAAQAGHDVVSCPDSHAYLDYRQSDHPGEPIPVGTVSSLLDVLAFDPVPAGLPTGLRHRILGGQCNLWTEHADNPRTLDYLAFPRLSAFAEAMWSGPPSSDADFLDFSARLAGHLDRLTALGVEYRPLDGPHPWQQRPDARGRPRDRASREAELAALTAGIRQVAGLD